MMTSSNGNIFRVIGPLCGEFTGPGELPTQRPVTRSFDVFFYLRLNKRLSKQPWGWWFETPSWSLWRQCNVNSLFAPGMSELLRLPVLWRYPYRYAFLNLDDNTPTWAKLRQPGRKYATRAMRTAKYINANAKRWGNVLSLYEYFLVCNETHFRRGATHRQRLVTHDIHLAIIFQTIKSICIPLHEMNERIKKWK